MTYPDPKVAVLIPAAGRGERLGPSKETSSIWVPKQFRLLAGEPLLHWTLRVFESHPRVDMIIVAAPERDVPYLPDRLVEAGISKLHSVVPGGNSRQESVANALNSVPSGVDLVLVHDAVRPFLSPEKLDNVIDAVIECGAAALALPVDDTLRRSADSVFGETVSRSGLYRMQTPQGFRTDWFVEAHRAAREAGFQETDDVALVQRLGYLVHIVEGSPANMKVTTVEDWDFAEVLFSGLQPVAAESRTSDGT